MMLKIPIIIILFEGEIRYDKIRRIFYLHFIFFFYIYVGQFFELKLDWNNFEDVVSLVYSISYITMAICANKIAGIKLRRFKLNFFLVKFVKIFYEDIFIQGIFFLFGCSYYLVAM